MNLIFALNNHLPNTVIYEGTKKKTPDARNYGRASRKRVTSAKESS